MAKQTTEKVLVCLINGRHHRLGDLRAGQVVRGYPDRQFTLKEFDAFAQSEFFEVRSVAPDAGTDELNPVVEQEADAGTGAK